MLFSIIRVCSYIKQVNKHICQLFHSNTLWAVPFTPEPLTFSFMSHNSSLHTVLELLACITTLSLKSCNQLNESANQLNNSTKHSRLTGCGFLFGKCHFRRETHEYIISQMNQKSAASISWIRCGRVRLVCGVAPVQASRFSSRAVENTNTWSNQITYSSFLDLWISNVVRKSCNNIKENIKLLICEKLATTIFRVLSASCVVENTSNK